MTRFLSVLALIFVMMLSGLAAQAQEMPWTHPSDKVIFDLSAEDWVTTKTAHVSVNVEAAVTNNNAGSLRTEMFKAVNDLIKADWRLTEFSRSESSSGVDQWSATFETRAPEADLNGLSETAKKLSKPGLQVTVGDIDFTPTLAETEAARAALRVQIYKQVNDQLAAANAAVPGRDYRISLVSFTGEGVEPPMPPMPMVMRGRPMMATAMASSAPGSAPQVERSEKVTLTARVVLAAAAPEKPAAGK